MELENKKEHINRCIKLGMDLKSSMFCSECTEEEMEAIEGDEEFLHRVRVIQHIQEASILDDFDIAMKIAAQKGNTSPMQWKLERINPNRWAKSTVTEEPGARKASVEVYIPDNGRGK